MINARELRLGNLLRHKSHHDLIFVVKGITETTLEVKSGTIQGYSEWNCADSMVEPLPLSESMLIDLGFTKRPSGQFVIKANEYEWINVQVDKQEICHSILDKGVNTPYNYIHELQNLYFALSGKELTTK